MNGLYFISHQTDKYSYLDSIQIALAGGVRHIQLRMKDASIAEVEKIALQAKEICVEYGAKLYVDDYVEVCKSVGLAGVHLGKQDMLPSEACKMLGADFVIGGTANSFEDIVRLKNEGVDYIGLGPFRFTTTKKNLSPVLGLEGYTEILQQCRENGISLPVFAIGGITKEDIPLLMQTGIAGIALSSAILQAENPVEETKEILSYLY